MNVHTLILATTPCATPNRTGGAIILAVILLALIVCAIGWSRAAKRASRAEGALDALRQSSGQ